MDQQAFDALQASWDRQQQQFKEQRREFEQFAQAAAARREEIAARIANGESIAYTAPDLDAIYRESKARHDGEFEQRETTVLATPYSWNGQGLPMPPHVVAAQRAAYIAEENARYAQRVAVADALRQQEAP